MVLAICINISILLIQKYRTINYLRHISLFVALLTILQISTGYRWQLVPAYTLSLMLIVLWALRQLKVKFSLSKFTAIALKVIVVIIFAVSVALPYLMPVFHFPEPTGAYQIGTVTYRWIDQNRPEVLTSDPEDFREVIAQVWYPTDASTGTRAPYVDDAHAMFEVISQGLAETTSKKTVLPNFLIDHLQYVETNALIDAPVSTHEESYPIILYLSGLGGFRSANMLQIQEFVSQGYIVIGIDQPYISANVSLSGGRTATMLSRNKIHELITTNSETKFVSPRQGTTTYLPDNIIPYLTEDALFVISNLNKMKTHSSHPLAKYFDMENIGMFGLSLGGRVVAETCRQEPSIKGCLMIDTAMPASVVESGLSQSAMWMTRPEDDMRKERSRSGGWSEEDITRTSETMKHVFNNQRPGTGYYVSVAGMSHLNFTDAPYWMPFTSQLGLWGTIDPVRGIKIVNDYSLAFYNKTLKGQEQKLLTAESPFPEVTITSR